MMDYNKISAQQAMEAIKLVNVAITKDMVVEEIVFVTRPRKKRTVEDCESLLNRIKTLAKVSQENSSGNIGKGKDNREHVASLEGILFLLTNGEMGAKGVLFDVECKACKASFEHDNPDVLITIQHGIMRDMSKLAAADATPQWRGPLEFGGQSTPS